MRRIETCLLAAWACIGLAGCGGGDTLADPRTMAPVKGKVMVGDAPLDGTGLSLNFSHEKGYNPTTVPLNPDGTFAGEAAVGMNKVVVVAGGAATTEHVEPTSRKVHRSFLSDETSTLQADVKADAAANDFTLDVSAAAGGVSGGKTGAHGR